MKVRLPDGTEVEVGNDDLLNDDGTPFQVPTGRIFTEEDVARIRSEEKDKIYGELQSTKQQLAELRQTVAQQTEAETARQQAERERLEAEQARLADEARKAEEAEMDARSLVERTRSEFTEQISTLEQQWNQRLAEEQQARQAAEATMAKEREFAELQQYAQTQVAAAEDDIAPQFIPYIQGNSRDEIDASIELAKQNTASLMESLAPYIQQQDQQVQQPLYTQQQVVPQPGNLPPLPGVRVTSGPGADPAATYQQYTAEQIAQMPMSEYAKLRPRLVGAGAQQRNQGLFG